MTGGPRYGLAGALLGLGAPAGYLLLRRLARGRAPALAYMSATTPLVFALFGAALARREGALRRAHAELDRLRDELTAVIAHDLRNPLNRISLRVELLLREAGSGDVRVPRASLDAVRDATRQLERQVRDLLDAGRLEARQLVLDRKPLDLGRAVAAAVERIRPTLGAHPVDVDAKEGVEVSADAGRLDQILANLLENAAKYSPAGAPINVRVGPGARIAVEDRGEGIAPKERARLFDRFYQTSRARAGQSGLGLGLYITRGLVEAHGGEITVASAPGQGSTFTIRLPVSS